MRTGKLYEEPDLVPHQVQYLEKEKAWRFYRSVLPVNPSENEKTYVPDDGVADLVPISSTIRNVEKIAYSVLNERPVFLVGTTGVGKTSLIRYLAKKTQHNLRRFNLNGQTDKAELIGSFRPVPHHGNGKIINAWRDGVLVEALKKGYWLVLDEMNLAESEILERLNSLLDDDMSLSIREHLGERLISWKQFDRATLELLGGTGITREDLILYHENRLKDAGKAQRIEAAVAGLNKRNIFRIHHQFRLFATGNPVDYAGRNVLSPAFLDRWQTKIIDEPTAGELVVILDQLYAKEDSRLAYFIRPLQLFHATLVSAARRGLIAFDERHSMEFTIRHLIRVLEHYRDDRATLRDPDDPQTKDWILARAINEVYIAGLPDKASQVRVMDQLDIWLPEIGKALRKRNHEVRIQVTDKVLTLGAARLPVQDEKGDPRVPGEFSVMPQTASLLADLEKIARSVQFREPVLLTGLTGVGKTSVIRYLAYLTRNHFERVGLDGQTDTSELMGEYQMTEGTAVQSQSRWCDGILIDALNKGYWILLDEVNLARPEILERINSLLDDDASLELTEHEGEVYRPVRAYRRHVNERLRAQGEPEVGLEELTERIIHQRWDDERGKVIAGVMQALEKTQKLKVIHPNFRIFAAQNPKSYAGRSYLSKAFRNKFNEIRMNAVASTAEFEQIIEFYRARDGVTLPPGATTSLAALFFRLFEAVEESRFDDRKLVFTMRDVKTVLHYLAKVPGARLGEAVSYVLSGRFSESKDRDQYFKMVKEAGIDPLILSYPDGASSIEIEDAGNSVKIGPVVLPKVSNPIAGDVSGAVQELTADVAKLEHTGRTVAYLERLAKAVLLREQSYLIGATGIGKTSLIRYLAYLTGNRYTRFNLNVQTDKMELLGGYLPKENGVLSYRWVDGVLIGALKRGEWLVLDEMNLAPPELLERLNSLFDDDQSLTLREHHGENFISAHRFDALLRTRVPGVTEAVIEAYFDGRLTDAVQKEALKKAVEALEHENTFRIHHNFRLFATANPDNYAGRQPQSPAFLNRFRLWYVEDLSPGEVAYIMARKFPSLRSRKRLIEFHYRVLKMLDEKTVGTGTHFTLRNLERALRRVAGGILPGEAFGDIYGSAREVDAALYDSIFQEFFDAPAETVIPEPVVRESVLDIAGMNFSRDIHNADLAIPSEKVAALNYGQTTLRLLRQTASALYFNEPLLLTGVTAVAKTAIIRCLAFLWNIGFQRVVLDGQTDTSELIGQYSMDTSGKGLGLVWKDGALIDAMRYGRILLLDELNLAAPEILERINPLLDDDTLIKITEHLGEVWKNARVYDPWLLAILQRKYAGMNFVLKDVKDFFGGKPLDALKRETLDAEQRALQKDGRGVFRIHDRFRLVAAQNPDTDEGRQRLSIAFRNKFTEVVVKPIQDVGELTAIAGMASARSETREKPDDFRELNRAEQGLLDRIRSVFEMLFNPHGRSGIFIHAGSGWAMNYRIRTDERTGKIQEAAIQDARDMTVPVADIREAVAIPKRVEELDAQVQAEPSVYNVPDARGYYFDDIIREAIWEKKKDPKKGRGWLTSKAAPGLLSSSERKELAEELQKKKENATISSVLHEGLHYDLSRPTGYAFSREARRALFNAIEDPRINSWAELKYPAGDILMRDMYDEIFPEKTRVDFDAHHVLPHLQFDYGIIHRWKYGTNHPGIKNKKVLKALDDLWPDIEQAYNSFPTEQLKFTRGPGDEMVVAYPDGRQERFQLPKYYKETTQKGSVTLDDGRLIVERESADRINITRRRLRQTGDLESDLIELSPLEEKGFEIPSAGKTRNLILEKDPPEDAKLDAAQRVEEIIRVKIEPRYEALIEESRRELKKRGKSRTGEKGGSGQSSNPQQTQPQGGEGGQRSNQGTDPGNSQTGSGEDEASPSEKPQSGSGKGERSSSEAPQPGDKQQASSRSGDSRGQSSPSEKSPTDSGSGKGERSSSSEAPKPGDKQQASSSSGDPRGDSSPSEKSPTDSGSGGKSSSERPETDDKGDRSSAPLKDSGTEKSPKDRSGSPEGKPSYRDFSDPEVVEQEIEDRSREFADAFGPKIKNAATQNAEREAKRAKEKEAEKEDGESAEQADGKTEGHETKPGSERDKASQGKEGKQEEKGKEEDGKDKTKSAADGNAEDEGKKPTETGEKEPGEKSQTRDAGAEGKEPKDKGENPADGSGPEQGKKDGKSSSQQSPGTGGGRSKGAEVESKSDAPSAVPQKQEMEPSVQGEPFEFDYDEFLKHLEESNQKADEYEKTHNVEYGVYSEVKRDVNYLIERFIGVLENILFKDMKPGFKGWFRAGKKLDRRKAVQSLAEYEAKGVFNDKIWLKKVLPKKRSYKFSYIVDMSGSMYDDREEVIRSMVLFIETMEALDIDYNLYWYSDSFEELKPFGKKLTQNDKDLIVTRLRRLNMGGTYESQVLTHSIEEQRKQEGDQKHIIMFTDAETRVDRVEPFLRKARDLGISVTAISYKRFNRGNVATVYAKAANGLLVENMEDLIYRLADVLKKAFIGGAVIPQRAASISKVQPFRLSGFGRSEVRLSAAEIEAVNQSPIAGKMEAMTAIASVSRKILRSEDGLLAYFEAMLDRFPSIEKNMAPLYPSGEGREHLLSGLIQIARSAIMGPEKPREVPEVSELLTQQVRSLAVKMADTAQRRALLTTIPMVVSADDLSPEVASGLFRHFLPTLVSAAGAPLLKMSVVLGKDAERFYLVRKAYARAVKEMPLLSSLVAFQRNDFSSASARCDRQNGFALANDEYLNGLQSTILGLGFESGSFTLLSLEDQLKTICVLITLGYQIRTAISENRQAFELRDLLLKYAYQNDPLAARLVISGRHLVLSDLSASLVNEIFANELIAKMA
ncbi:MAG: AAA family ATPase [Candidatus Omnitrophica bacterium]|nr:AAA family ATPase [Candidatus Omnitrophota bacterium]